MSLENALEYLYSSQLYALLEREETKMWYYSSQMLLHLLENEKKQANYHSLNKQIEWKTIAEYTNSLFFVLKIIDISSS